MTAKFTLDEAFDEAYNQFLAEIQEEQLHQDVLDALDESERVSDQFIATMEILQENIASMTTGDHHTENRQGQQSSVPANASANYHGHEEDKARNDDDSYTSLMKSMSKELNSRLANIAADKILPAGKAGSEIFDYKPETGALLVQSTANMSFPEKIMAFIKELVIWIKNHVLDIIDKLSNIFRNILGLSVGPSRFKPEDLKFSLQTAKKIETLALPSSVNSVKSVTSFDDILNPRTDSRGNQQNYHKISSVAPFKVLQLSSNDITTLESAAPSISSAMLLEDGAFPDRIQTGPTVSVVSIDTSNDLLNLREYMNHFFELFDNAFGSNSENLFSTDDLAIMLNMFTVTLNKMQHPETVKPVQINGQITINYNDIDPMKVRDNMIRTKLNVDKLKKAYQTTYDQINLIAKIIGNKQILGSAEMGNSFAIMSSSTYSVMIDLIGVIERRLKDAVRMEKDLKKMRDKYSKLVAQLDNYRSISLPVAKVSFTTAVQQQINQLFDAARYAAQTVAYRLEALSLYVSELNDVRAILVNLNSINMVHRTGWQNIKDWFKTHFSHKRTVM